MLWTFAIFMLVVIFVQFAPVFKDSEKPISHLGMYIRIPISAALIFTFLASVGIALSSFPTLQFGSAPSVILSSIATLATTLCVTYLLGLVLILLINFVISPAVKFADTKTKRFLSSINSSFIGRIILAAITIYLFGLIFGAYGFGAFLISIICIIESNRLKSRLVKVEDSLPKGTY